MRAKLFDIFIDMLTDALEEYAIESEDTENND